MTDSIEAKLLCLYPPYMGAKWHEEKDGTITVRLDNKVREVHRFVINDGRLCPLRPFVERKNG